MATHYRGQRIDELLDEVARYEKSLNARDDKEPDPQVAQAWTALALAKAKLTALQGESNDN